MYVLICAGCSGSVCVCSSVVCVGFCCVFVYVLCLFCVIASAVVFPDVFRFCSCCRVHMLVFFCVCVCFCMLVCERVCISCGCVRFSIRLSMCLRLLVHVLVVCYESSLGFLVACVGLGVFEFG